MSKFNSCNSKATTIGTGMFQVLRTTLTSVMAITGALVLAGTVMGLSGCSKDKSKSDAAELKPSQNNSQPVVSTIPQTLPEPVAKKQRTTIKRPSTLTYSSRTYGLSFRFPGQYELTTPGYVNEKSALTEEVPQNFAQPGGVTVATIDLAGGPATSFFSVSANKGVTTDECEQFSTPSPSDVAANSPVDPNDGSIPSKATIHGVKFTTVENASEQEDVKYYHHFEPESEGGVGTCYEFALGVEQSRVSSKTVDYPQVFDKLERIMATVEIKSQDNSTVTATVPAHELSGTSPQ